MENNKSYAVKEWTPVKGNAEWLQIRIGTLHYSKLSKFKPSGFGYSVAFWNYAYKKNYTESKAGWDFVERIELDKDVYQGLVQQFIDCPVNDECEDVYFDAVFVVSQQLTRYISLVEPGILSFDAELQQKKVARVFESAQKKTQWEPLFDEILYKRDLFDNALIAVNGFDKEKKQRFFESLTSFIAFNFYIRNKDRQLLRDCLAAACLVQFPETANAATTALVVETLDFLDDNFGKKTLAILNAAFGHKKENIEAINLPTDFSQ